MAQQNKQTQQTQQRGLHNKRQQLASTITLNELEARICMRIAGGWVRDKLLGRESDDIDVTIDTMQGEPFAHHLKEYMKSAGMEADMGSIATIQVNPDKSKHLETATARLFGLDIDFVHLRTETYDDDSRNPIVGFGTPAQDAFRRDITINALFYNIQTREIEDLTQHGLDDLANGIIRTPLDPLQTFIDDPLRVLRVIRFATRFGYEIVPGVLEAARDDQIKYFMSCIECLTCERLSNYEIWMDVWLGFSQAAFSKKITKERVGVELDKMLNGADPVRAIRLLIDIGFYPLVFETPAELAEQEIQQEHRAYIASRIIHMIEDRGLLSFLGLISLPVTPENIRSLHLAAAVVPLQGLYFKQKNRDVSAVRHVLSNLDGDITNALLNFYPQIRNAAMRNHATENGLDRMPLDAECRAVIGIYADLMASIVGHGVEMAHEVKPLLDGKEVAAALGLRPGPVIGKYLNAIMEWQLSHVNATKEQCLKYLRDHLEPQSQ
eukprot:jgi/Hompol1/950/HPOL_004341-RA